MSPLHSIDFCPICGGGLCGIRICGLADPSDTPDQENEAVVSSSPHGLVVCDECEAIWLEPNLRSDHQYPIAEDARCPICELPLWGPQSRWANAVDAKTLGWEKLINHELDHEECS